MTNRRVWLIPVLALVGACSGSNEAESISVQQAALTAAQCSHFEVGGKTQICHATSSAKHPYTILKVSEQACINAHADHAGDYVAVGDPTCQGGGCLPITAPCDATVPCCDGLSCTDGTCQCPSGQTDCNGTCIDTTTDTANCGACGVGCPYGSSCEAGTCVAPPPPPPSPFTAFSLPSAQCRPFRITVGADGNLWFSEPGCNKIGRITVSGEITEFPVPGPNPSPHGICLGPDGNVWFTEPNVGTIGKITPAGVITEYAFPGAGFLPWGIASGPDGNLWVGDVAGAVRRVTPAGVLTTFLVTSDPSSTPYPFEITAGPDGNLWFTEEASGDIGRITVGGVITKFPAVTPIGSFDTALRAIARGPDGNLWFTTNSHNQVGRISVAGDVTLFALANANSYPEDITPGPDGNLWFTEYLGGRLGRITPSGVITEVAFTSPSAFPSGIVTGPDGAIWFTTIDAFGGDIGNKIVRYQP